MPKPIRIHIHTADADQWITVHPNGKGNGSGAHVLIGANGQVKAGMGGKFNGEKIHEVRSNFVGPKSHQAKPPQPEQKPKPSASVKLKEGHKQVSRPFPVEKDDWGDYTAPGINGSLPKQHVTVKNGHVVGMNPSLALNTGTEVEGEAQAKSEKTLAKEREATEKKERENREREDAAAIAVFHMTLSKKLAGVSPAVIGEVKRDLSNVLQNESLRPAERVREANKMIEEAKRK